MSVRKGVFHVIATPIGNLADITQRAREVIASVDVLYAEDTRHTARLCSHLGVAPQLRSLHDHNESDRIPEIMAQLQEGLAIGLVSDAGTPLISDPGYRIVAACQQKGLPVSPVPGVSALTAVLSVCGLPTDRFLFEGFLPAKSAARVKALQSLQTEAATIVFFESKHRIKSALADMHAVLGDRLICVAREVTKAFESFYHGSISEVMQRIEDDADCQKGEFVVVVSGAPQSSKSFNVEIQSLLTDVAKEIPPKRAAKIVANYCGLPAKELYQWLLQQKEQG